MRLCDCCVSKHQNTAADYSEVPVSRGCDIFSTETLRRSENKFLVVTHLLSDNVFFFTYILF